MGSFYSRRGKRILDLVGGSTALILTSPIQLVAAMAVRGTLGTPVLFKQVRPGLTGQPFTLLKFRTMRSIEFGHSRGETDSDRLTRLGRFLRSTSIDELPELWNVVRGDMSLIGPRPLLTDYLDRYSPEQTRRHEVRPGVTGWAQVNGRNTLNWEDKFNMDVWYVDHISLLVDVKILWRTVKTVFSRSGISADGHATMPEFKPKA